MDEAEKNPKTATEAATTEKARESRAGEIEAAQGNTMDFEEISPEAKQATI